jgi:hypothetical protein
MTTHTQTSESKTSDQYAQQPDIEKHRARLQKKVSERQSREDAIRAHLSEQERLAVDSVAAILEVCKGIIDRVEAYPINNGYQISVCGTPAVNITVRPAEPHTAISVAVSGPKHLPGWSTPLSCYSVDSVVGKALDFIGN